MTDQTRTPREELISASNCLYLEVHESIAKDVRKKIDAVLAEMDTLTEALIKTCLYQDQNFTVCHHCGAQGKTVCSPGVVHKPTCLVSKYQKEDKL